mgnify:CR=1 FL=1
MDLLQPIKQYTVPALQAMTAFELWNQTGSREAFDQVYTHGTPIHKILLLGIKQQ